MYWLALTHSTVFAGDIFSETSPPIPQAGGRPGRLGRPCVPGPPPQAPLRQLLLLRQPWPEHGWPGAWPAAGHT